MLIGILGVAIVTWLCRAGFLLPSRDVPLPNWLNEALRHAQTAALAAVVAPAIFGMPDDIVTSWHDSRLVGVAVACAFFPWKKDLLGTMITGTGAMLIAQHFLK